MKLTVPEKRDATVYGYVTQKNRKWLDGQAKKHGLKLSPTLDMFLNKLRSQYPLKKKTV